MAYYLGKDVDLTWTTENPSRGVSVAPDGTMSAPTVVANVSGAGMLDAPDFTNSGMADITGLDLSIGATDEDVAFLGVRTPLKAEVHKETTVTITKKKSNKVFDVLFASGGRWGLDVDNAFFDGLTMPTVYTGGSFGYRLFVQLKSGQEVFVVRGAQMASHTVTLNADGTQEETLEFTSQVQPKIFENATDGGIGTAVSAAEL